MSGRGGVGIGLGSYKSHSECHAEGRQETLGVVRPPQPLPLVHSPQSLLSSSSLLFPFPHALQLLPQGGVCL